MIRLSQVMFYLVGLFIIIACSPVKLPTVSSYTLTSTELFATPAHAKTQQTLYVELPVANPGYESSNMLYMATPSKLSSFSQNQWVAPPAYLLQSIVTQAIRARGYFKAVTLVPASLDASYRLELQLLNLQQEFLTSTSKIRMGVQATLVNNANSQVIRSQRFDALVSTTANNPYAGVLAANQAVTSIAVRIATFCVAHANQN